MSETTVSGREAIANAFDTALQSRSAALMPYYTLGFPDRQTSLDVVEAIAPYSDLLELGLSFSDPLADGPTIQHSTQVALQNGTTTVDCLEMVRELRARGVTTPIMMFGYYNPIVAYGLEKFVADAKEAGAQGFIVPDLPPEEAYELEELATSAEMIYVHFLAPTSNPKRIENVTQRAQGFIYMVSVTGVTGARNKLQDALPPFVERVRAETDARLAIGFGISTPELAAAAGDLADGVIVGSALIDAVDSAEGDKPAAAAAFVKALHDAL